MSDPLAAVAAWLLRLKALHHTESQELLQLRYSGAPDIEREQDNERLAMGIKATQDYLDSQVLLDHRLL